MLLDGTDGEEIVFTRGRTGEEWAPDLWAFRPGDMEPGLIWEDPNRNAQIHVLAVHHGRYAFEELSTNKDGSGTWRLWYLASRTAKPIILDSNAGDPRDMPVAGVTPALTDSQVTWNAMHMVGGKVIWSLRSYDFLTGKTRILIQGEDDVTEYWFPDADDQGRLVFSDVEYGPDRSYDNAKFHVFIANLADNPIKPRRLDTDGFASEPVLVADGDTVVWKGVDRPFWVGNWSQLYRYSLSKGDVRILNFDAQPGMAYQTAGNRFVVGWEWDSTRFLVYDLETDSTLYLEKHDPRSPEGVTRAVVAGDMVVFIRGNRDLPGGKNKWLCYAKLPPPGASLYTAQ